MRSQRPDDYNKHVMDARAPEGGRRGPKERALSRTFIEDAVRSFEVREIRGRILLCRDRFVQYYKTQFGYTEATVADLPFRLG